MKSLVLILGMCLLLQAFARAEAPGPQPTTLTGTIGKPDDPGVAATLGHHGVLFIRSEARWQELQDRLGEAMALKPDAALPQFDFAKQSVVLLYTDDQRQAAALSLSKSDLAANPPQLGFFLRWDNGPELQRTRRYVKFILAVVPVAPAVRVTVSSEPLNAERTLIVTEFSAALSDKDGLDRVDGLQASITPAVAVLKPGEDIRIDFTLHLADSGPAKPEQFGAVPKSVFVWDGKYSHGYRNHAFFVTTPDGKTTLLRPAVIEHWLKNIPHPVEINADTPYPLPSWVEGDTHKSLKQLGFDTTAPGRYTITGLYEETAAGERSEAPMWGGSILSNTITVEIKK